MENLADTKDTKLKACQKPCSECPFRKVSAKGWLGPHSALDLFVIYKHDMEFKCHKEIDSKGTDASMCRGYIHSRVLSCMSSRNMSLAKLENEYKGLAKHSNCMNMFEFIKHHKSAGSSRKTTSDIPVPEVMLVSIIDMINNKTD